MDRALLRYLLQSLRMSGHGSRFALSLSRLAYDMESLTSPILAAGLLTVISYHWLFSGTAIGFAASAMLVLSTTLPKPKPVEDEGGIYDKTTRGTRIYLKTPRLRGLLALITVTFARADGYWYMLIAGWIVLGLAYSASVTPSGRLLRRSAPTSSVRGCGPACGGHHTPRPGLRPQ